MSQQKAYTTPSNGSQATYSARCTSRSEAAQVFCPPCQQSGHRNAAVAALTARPEDRMHNFTAGERPTAVLSPQRHVVPESPVERRFYGMHAPPNGLRGGAAALPAVGEAVL